MSECCRYMDAEMRFCGAPATFDAHRGADHFPRCERHKRKSAEQSKERHEQFMFDRALDRGLVSQCEMLHRLEAEMEDELERFVCMGRR